MWFWVAAILAGWTWSLWKRYQRYRATTWPITQGHVETVDVTRPTKWLRTSDKPSSDIAEIGYSYSVDGSIFGGFYQREFASADAAWEFLRDLKGKPVTVHYNPARPSSSAISDDSIEILILARSPECEEQSRRMPPTPIWVKPFLWLGVIYSATGLVLSLYVHIAALRGQRVLPDGFFWGLHIGIFVIWVPTLIVAKELTRDAQRKQDYWKLALKDAPEWMRYMVFGFFGYACINFLIFLLHDPSRHGGGSPSPLEWRGFSGHWMVFYSVAMAILYSAANYGGSLP